MNNDGNVEFENVNSDIVEMPEFKEMTPMQKFVINFMNRRKTQDKKKSDKRMLSVYCQIARFKHLQKYMAGKFVGAGLMSKSEIFDFMIFLLENYLNGTYKDYETFDEYYERELASQVTENNDGK